VSKVLHYITKTGTSNSNSSLWFCQLDDTSASGLPKSTPINPKSFVWVDMAWVIVVENVSETNHESSK